MRKFVLGIALVVCLDLAFIWMMANEAGVPEMARAVVPRVTRTVNLETPPKDSVTVDVAEDSDGRDPFLNSRVERSGPGTGTFSATRIRTSRPGIDRTRSAETRRLFPDKIIYIGQRDTYEFPDQRNDSPRVNVPAEPEPKSLDDGSEAKKRSFESRAFGVIKKPFKWIRSVASKLKN